MDAVGDPPGNAATPSGFAGIAKGSFKEAVDDSFPNLLTATDVREELNAALNGFATNALHAELIEFTETLKQEIRWMREGPTNVAPANTSLHAEFIELGETLKREFSSMLEDRGASLVPSSVNNLLHHELVEFREGLKQELNSLLEEYSGSQVEAPQAEAHRPAVPLDSRSRKPAPLFSQRAYRGFLARQTMADHEVDGELSQGGVAPHVKVPSIDSTETDHVKANMARPLSKEARPLSKEREHVSSAEGASHSQHRHETVTGPEAMMATTSSDVGGTISTQQYSQLAKLHLVPPGSAGRQNGAEGTLSSSMGMGSLFGPHKHNINSDIAKHVHWDTKQRLEPQLAQVVPVNEKKPNVKTEEDDGHSYTPAKRGTVGTVLSSDGAPRGMSSPNVHHHRQREAVFLGKSLVAEDRKNSRVEQAKHNLTGHDTIIMVMAAHFVHSFTFDVGSALLILLNALWIGAQTDHVARNDKDDALPAFFTAIDTVFALLFSMELALRLFVFRDKFFLGPGYKWNLFDSVLVLLQLVELVFQFVVNGSKERVSSFSFLRIVRIFRLIRIVRLVRVVRMIGELRTIVSSILGSLKSLAWTIALLTLLIYVVGIYFTQLVSDSDRAREDEVLRKYYGSLFRSLLSLFEAFTGGLDWDNLADPLILNVHPICGVVFALYIAFSVLAMMNVVTGVFVESALMTARHDKDVDLVNHLREVFVKTDEDRTGTIGWEEFHRHIEDAQMDIVFKAVDLDRSEARGLFELIDVDNRGEISREEFIMGCLRLKGPAKALDLATLMYDNKRLANMLEEHILLIESRLFDQEPNSPMSPTSSTRSTRATRAAARNSEIDAFIPVKRSATVISESIDLSAKLENWNHVSDATTQGDVRSFAEVSDINDVTVEDV